MTLKTIVVTTLMKMTRPVQDAIANVQNRNSDVATTNVFRADGNVIMTMVRYFLNILYTLIYCKQFDTLQFHDFLGFFFQIAETEVTKPLVERINVQLTNSNVPLVIASKKV